VSIDRARRAEQQALIGQARIEHDPDGGIMIGIGRPDIIRRVGNLAEHGDRRRYSGKHIARWLDAAVNGDAEALRQASTELRRLGF
jgi:hypothetical protein